MADRVFTDEQLAELGKRTIEKAYDAIEAGDGSQARELVDLMYSQFAKLHDGYMTWITGLLTWIYEHEGADALEAAEVFAHAVEAKLVFFPPERTDFEFTVRNMATELQGHVNQQMTLEEDDEKVTLTVTPCGSGGRLIQMGAYTSAVGLARVRESRGVTFNTNDYPIYCLHCPLFNRNAIDGTGDFIFCNTPPPADGASCQWLFYKDKADIPAEFYTRLDRQKPETQGDTG
jgi:hypothetical protein